MVGYAWLHHLLVIQYGWLYHLVYQDEIGTTIGRVISDDFGSDFTGVRLVDGIIHEENAQ